MWWGRHKLRLVKQLLARLGLSVTRLSEQDRRYLLGGHCTDVPLPQGALQTLQADNPQLIELRRAYRDSGLVVTRHSLWADETLSQELELRWFRGDNAYVWQLRQLRSQARLKQYLNLLDVREQDHLSLLDQLGEDGLFGCWTFEYANTQAVSRDLLDSVREINFLERHLGLSGRHDLRVLDIGAGYGRLAYRMCQAMPKLVAYDCVDAVAESTFLCDYYLNFRGVTPRARSLPLTRFASSAEHPAYQLAVNIHSFTECTRETIVWWLQRLAELEVEHLLIVPNDADGLVSSEIDGSRIACDEDVAAAGFELVVREPVIANDELRELIGVNDHFFLYRRRGT